MVSTLSEDGKATYSKTINTSAADIPVALDIDNVFAPRRATLEQIAPASLSVANSFTNPEAIHVKEGQAEIDGQKVDFVVLRYGAVIVAVSQNVGAGIGRIDEKGINQFRLYYNFPNPFNPATSITYELPRQDRVKLQVTDLLGHVVAVLVDKTQDRGRYQVEWNGKNDAGTEVSSGLYFYELITASQKIVRKMILLR